MAWTGPECLPSLMVTNVNTGVTMRADEAAKQYGGVDLGSTGDLQPMLGLGSNASPFQLARKFGKSGHAIPVLQCVLAGWDVVYAAHVSFYGSATATLAPCPGAAVEVALLLLDENQAAAMDATEGGHDLCCMTGVDLHVARSLDQVESGQTNAGEMEDQVVLAYLHSNGALTLPPEEDAPATPIAVAAVRASGRTFPALTQDAMLCAINRMCSIADSSSMSSVQQAMCSSRCADCSIDGSPRDEDLDLWVLSVTDSKPMKSSVNKVVKTAAQKKSDKRVVPAYASSWFISGGSNGKRSGNRK